MATLEEVVSGIKEEIEYQNKTHGANRDLNNWDYALIANNEWAEVGADVLMENWEHARLEMMQVITVGVKWLMDHGIERREDHA